MSMAPFLHLLCVVSASMGQAHALLPLQQYLPAFRVFSDPKTESMLSPAPVSIGSSMTLFDNATVSCTCDLKNSTHANSAMKMMKVVCNETRPIDNHIGTIYGSGAVALSAASSTSTTECNETIVEDSYKSVTNKCGSKQGAIVYADGLVFSVRNSW